MLFMKWVKIKMSNEIKEILMTPQQIEEEIEFEDKCGMNTLLQNLLNTDIQKTGEVYRKINDKDEICGYVIRDKITKEDIQL